MIISGEQLLAKLIFSMKNTQNFSVSEFCRQFYEMDVLIVEDIQHIKDKHTTQECLIEITQHFVENGKQLIFTVNALEELDQFYPQLKTQFASSVQVRIEESTEKLRSKILEEFCKEKEYELAQKMLDGIKNSVVEKEQKEYFAYIQGLVYLGIGKSEKAVDILEGLEYRDSEQLLKEAYLEVACLMAWRNNTSRAVEFFEKAGYREGDYVDLYLELKSKDTKNKYYKAACELLEESLEKDEEDIFYENTKKYLEDIREIEGYWVMPTERSKVNLIFVDYETIAGDAVTTDNSTESIEHAIKNFEMSTSLFGGGMKYSIASNGDGTYTILTYYYDGKTDSSKRDYMQLKISGDAIEVSSSLDEKMIGFYTKYR